MSAAPQSPRQALVATWGAQIVGTIVIAVVVYYYFRYAGSPFAGNEEWARWAQNAILLAALPAMMYLRKYKPWLDADAKALRLHGRPDPAVRRIRRCARASCAASRSAARCASCRWRWAWCTCCSAASRAGSWARR
jgi:hypothetical protein